MLPYHAKSDVFPSVPAGRPPAPPLPAFANVFADFSPGFADALAPVFFACASSTVFFFLAALTDFAASESCFLTGVIWVFAGAFLFGADFGTGFRVGWGAGFGVGLGVTVGVTLGSSISLFTTGAGSVSIFAGGLLAAGVGSGDDSDFS